MTNEEKLAELTDLEYELLLLDNIHKKFKKILSENRKSEKLLMVYMSTIEAVRAFKLTAQKNSRKILQEDAINYIISSGESYLSMVANDESKALYIDKFCDDCLEILKLVVLILKSDLVDSGIYQKLIEQSEEQ